MLQKHNAIKFQVELFDVYVKAIQCNYDNDDVDSNHVPRGGIDSKLLWTIIQQSEINTHIEKTLK